MTVPILEGLDGVQKMSKSLNNYIALNDPPGEMFGKVMKISDPLMWRYYDLLSFKPLGAIAALRKSVEEGANPRDLKMGLGVELVDRFHGTGSGEQAKAAFIAQFSQGNLPENIPEIMLAVPPEGLLLARVLKEAGLVASNGEGNRMIEQKAVRLDSERVEDRSLVLQAGASHLLQVGSRRYARVMLKAI
jgi:tyrosyl-tRNA synthetase